MWEAILIILAMILTAWSIIGLMFISVIMADIISKMIIRRK